MKKVLISILTLIFIVLMITTVNAASASIALGSSTDSVVKGKTFTMTIAGAADNNITALQASLSYDSSKLSIESKSAATGFSDLSGANEIATAATSNENLSKSGTLYTIIFKVLDTAEVGETTISVKNTTLALVNENSEQENVSVADDDVVVTIKADDTTVDNQGGATTEDNNTQTEEQGNTTTTPSNTTDSGNESNNSNSSNNENKNTNTNKNVNTSKNTSTNKNTTKLPQTGAESASVIAIIALGAISIASYVSYRKYKNI